MKKITLALIAVLSTLSFFAHAQWTTSGTYIYNSNTGNIGIGTTSDTGDKLQVSSSNNPASSYGLSIGPYPTRLGLGYDATNGYGYILSTNTGTGYTPLSLQRYGGYVGIGTASPAATLDVNGSQRLNGNLTFATDQTAYFIQGPANGGAIRIRSNGSVASDRDLQFGAVDNTGAWSSYMTVANNGKVGIGTTSPAYTLDVQGGNVGIYNTGSATTLAIGSVAAGKTYLSLSTSADASGKGIIQSVSASGSVYGSTIINPTGGFVGIGTSIPDQLLTVKGTIHSQEVKVDLSVPGPDYVFEKNYKLNTLKEIQEYIDKHKHLPEIPSAKEMEKDGINLSEMNMKLLKKVEELTLYLIEKDKEVNAQQKEINQLKDQQVANRSQQEQINELNKKLEILLKSKL